MTSLNVHAEKKNKSLLGVATGMFRLFMDLYFAGFEYCS